MSSQTESPARAVRSAVVTWLATSRWSVPIALMALPVVGAVLMTIGQNHATARDWWSLGGGAATLLVGGFLHIVREVARVRTLDEKADEAGALRVAMKDALQPVAELIADMPRKTKGQREAALNVVAQQAVGALTLLLKDVYRLRAVVYALDANGMSQIAYHGRGGTPPKPFESGTDRGDLALKMVSDGKDHFERDINESTPEAYRGSGNGYRTFISAAIHTGNDGYGMVTVDAPRPGDLVDTDRQIVLMIADLLAIAFALAES